MIEYDGTNASARMIRHELRFEVLSAPRGVSQRFHYTLYFEAHPRGEYHRGSLELYQWEGEDISQGLAWLYKNKLQWMVTPDRWIWPLWVGYMAYLLAEDGTTTDFWIVGKPLEVNND